MCKQNYIFICLGYFYSFIWQTYDYSSFDINIFLSTVRKSGSGIDNVLLEDRTPF